MRAPAWFYENENEFVENVNKLVIDKKYALSGEIDFAMQNNWKIIFKKLLKL